MVRREPPSTVNGSRNGVRARNGGRRTERARRLASPDQAVRELLPPSDRCKCSWCGCPSMRSCPAHHRTSRARAQLASGSSCRGHPGVPHPGQKVGGLARGDQIRQSRKRGGWIGRGPSVSGPRLVDLCRSSPDRLLAVGKISVVVPTRSCVAGLDWRVGLEIRRTAVDRHRVLDPARGSFGRSDHGDYPVTH